MAWKKVWTKGGYKWVKDGRWDHGGSQQNRRPRVSPRAGEDNRERGGSGASKPDPLAAPLGSGRS
eukprot:15254086-Alexandrium_andersonii.AAC.1